MTPLERAEKIWEDRYAMPKDFLVDSGCPAGCKVPCKEDFFHVIAAQIVEAEREAFAKGKEAGLIDKAFNCDEHCVTAKNEGLVSGFIQARDKAVGILKEECEGVSDENCQCCACLHADRLREMKLEEK